MSEERIAVVLTGTNFEELLGVPIVIDETGRKVSATVLRLLDTYQVADKIIGLSFHTTASNSCMISGACTIIKQSFGRPLLWMASRHDIYEVSKTPMNSSSALSQVLRFPSSSDSEKMGLLEQDIRRYPQRRTTLG